MLAESLDGEELEDYNYTVLTAIAFNSPKKLRRWEWQSADRAGTRPALGRKNAAESLGQLAMALSGGKMEVNLEQRIASAKDRASGTNRPFMYMDMEGNYYDENGNLSERLPDAILVRVEKVPVTH